MAFVLNTLKWRRPFKMFTNEKGTFIFQMKIHTHAWGRRGELVHVATYI